MTEDICRARQFAAARAWVICPKPFSWPILAAGGRIDVWDTEPELPPFCSRPIFFRRRDGRVTAILAQRVSADDHAACQQFAEAHGLAIEQPVDWPGAVLWTRSPEAIAKEQLERQKAWVREVERDWQIIGRQRLRNVGRG
jgi:hypothetical protein